MGWAPNGISLCLVVLAGLVIPASIFKYSQAIAAGEPLTIVYHGELGKALALVLFASLAIVFLAAVLVAGRLQSRRDERWVLMISGVLVFLFVMVYPLGSRHLFKNIVDSRTLWVYHQNPLKTQPARSDALIDSVTVPRLRRAPAYYGPLYYALSGPAVVVGGDSLVRNLVAFKALAGL